ncbi:hypothetical protein M885DRAFT_521874 [Pelagophyceae sp. CCMP2097]|nr:hypothetical protein M885DRAFT_521874 [Pelagophyceae sp. CCMP2097]|mmetsp:Transcript_30153/g.101644  ORF Transcript_30153/g.101644 Transcript_30153/m.101644 type:complete len:152 (-) Transcript_30153:144-599(-)
MRLVIETYHQPLCVAPTLSAKRCVVELEPTDTVAALKLAIQALSKTRAGRAALTPERQILAYVPEACGDGIRRKVILDSEDTTLVAYDVLEDGKISLKVTPYEPRAVGVAAWQNDFATFGSLNRKPPPAPLPREDSDLDEFDDGATDADDI